MSQTTIELRDEQSGTTASVRSDYGFNCSAFRPVINGRPIDVIFWTDDFPEQIESAVLRGIPLLFPFAGRIRGTTYDYGGTTYTLGDCMIADGNAIHGFVHHRPWRVTEQTTKRVSGVFQASVDAPEVLAQWPADYELTATYEVRGQSLIGTYGVKNPDQKPLPFSFGTHHYFQVPIGGSDAGACRITVPARSLWPMEQVLPTGEKIPMPPDRALRDRPFGGFEASDIQSDLETGRAGVEPGKPSEMNTIFDVSQSALGVPRSTTAEPPPPSEEGERVRCQIVDPNSGVTVTQAFSTDFPFVVSWNPPHRQAFCIEPYTALPNFFELDAQGVDTGLRELQPGESWSTVITISVT